MECPVCSKSLDNLPFDDRLRHVNHCLDGSGSGSGSSSSTASSNNHYGQLHPYFTGIRSKRPGKIACPVCMKDDVTAAHIKKCGKTNGILPKRLVSLVQKRTKSPQASKAVKTTGSTNHVSKQRAVLQSRENENELCEALPEERKLTLVAEFVDGFKNSIVNNKPDSNDVCEVASSVWQLSSLSVVNSFTVERFSKYCENLQMKCNLNGYQSNPLDLAPETLQEPQTDSFNNTEFVLAKLKSLVNIPSNGDLVVKAGDNEILHCHSFIWKLHSLAEDVISRDDNEQAYVDCTDFDKSVVLKFLHYCYAGTISFENDEDALRRLSVKLDCASLVDFFSKNDSKS